MEFETYTNSSLLRPADPTLRGRQPHERVWVQRHKCRFPERDPLIGPFLQCKEVWSVVWHEEAQDSLEDAWQEWSGKAERYLVEHRQVGNTSSRI
eukprot:4146989-Amphidinium_carterae.2